MEKNGKHLERLSAQIIYEGEDKMLDVKKSNLMELSKEELVERLLTKSEEMAEKKTRQNQPERLSQSLLEEQRILQLMRQHNISRTCAERLYLEKLNRIFIETEDGISVERIEERWD